MTQGGAARTTCPEYVSSSRVIPPGRRPPPFTRPRPPSPAPGKLRPPRRQKLLRGPAGAGTPQWRDEEGGFVFIAPPCGRLRHRNNHARGWRNSSEKQAHCVFPSCPPHAATQVPGSTGRWAAKAKPKSATSCPLGALLLSSSLLLPPGRSLPSPCAPPPVSMAPRSRALLQRRPIRLPFETCSSPRLAQEAGGTAQQCYRAEQK